MMRVRVVVIGLCLGLLVSARGEGQTDARTVEIRVSERLGVVKFRFYREEGPGTKRMVQAKVHQLVVTPHDGSVATWLIAAPRSGGATEITYGDLPAGFEQRVPGEEFAPSLEPDVTYRVSVILVSGFGSTTFRYSGR